MLVSAITKGHASLKPSSLPAGEIRPWRSAGEPIEIVYSQSHLSATDGQNQKENQNQKKDVRDSELFGSTS